MQTKGSHPKAIWNNSLIADWLSHPEKYQPTESEQKAVEQYVAEERAWQLSRNYAPNW